ncbi:MAG: hypothetical protein WD734_05055 [Dehalococcoidia bacterium]
MTMEEPLWMETVAPERICQRCQHAEGDHFETDYELAGATARRIYCEPCDDWHDFVPEPRAD